MDESKKLKQYNLMTKTPMVRLILRLSAPTIVSMMISSIYNMADTFFVSQLGTSASGAVGVVFPLTAVLQAVGFMIGSGAGAGFPYTLERENRKKRIKRRLQHCLHRF